MAAIIDLPVTRPGAAPEDWQHFDLVLGLTEDLLPVVSNPRAVIDPESTLKELGKTPSRYNGARRAVGIGKWTEHVTTPAEIAGWARERDYGICLQTRRVRALDVDVTDPALAGRIATFLAAFGLPVRSRANAAKFLVAFEMPGDFAKRRVKCGGKNMVEFLATGQQFVAVGLHPSGSRYEWLAGLPDAFPVLSEADFEALWSQLAATFGVEAPTESQASVKGEKLASAIDADPVAQHLLNAGRVKRTERDGRLHITCPFEDEHTGDSGETSTTYWPAHTGGYINGHFRCLHAHCEHRQDQDFRDAIGFAPEGEFEAIADEHDPQPIKSDVTIEAPAKPAESKYRFETAEEFCARPAPAWIVDGVLPQADLGIVFGEPGAGKTFFLLDLVAAIARGATWRGIEIQRRRVAYVVAEGAAGFRNRMKAYAQQHGIAVRDMGLIVLSAAPNLLDDKEARAVAHAAHAAGGADLLVLDTFSQVMQGGNENSGEDVGKVLKHCRGISKMLNGTMVIAVHHSGKDASRGARGWSGLKGAADVEIEVLAANGKHVAQVTKQKDGEAGLEFGFTLPKVVVEPGVDGRKEVTSCFVEHTSGVVREIVREKGPKGAVEKLIVEQLEELVSLGTDGIEVTMLMDKVRAQMPFDPNDGKRDQRGFRIHRALESLRSAKRIAVDGVKVKLA